MSTANFAFTGTQHEQDPRWTAVDAYAQPLVHPPSRPNAAALAHILEASEAAGLPDVSASPAQAKFLALLTRATQAKTALEVGTLGGYTASWLASENPGLHVTTIEFEPARVAVARENIATAKLSDRIVVVQGKGMDVLPRIAQEVREGKRDKFDFVFIDADKENNWNYFDIAAGITRSGGIVCVDNVVRQGRVADGADEDSRVRASREVIEKAGRDGRVDSVVIQTVGEKSYDGALWALVN